MHISSVFSGRREQHGVAPNETDISAASNFDLVLLPLSLTKMLTEWGHFDRKTDRPKSSDGGAASSSATGAARRHIEHDFGPR